MTRIQILALFAVAFAAGPGVGQYLGAIGYTTLQGRLGATTPNGSGVWVAQVEGLDLNNNYAPDPSVADGRPGFSLSLKSGTTGTSSHATGVAGIFFGNGGMATGITQVDSYAANHWTSTGFLGVGSTLPQVTNIPKVSNHSYVGTASPSATLETLSRSDYLVDRGDHIMVVGVGANDPGTPPSTLFGSGYNSIAVGRTDGRHFGGLTSPDVGGGRVKPDLVAPQGTVSNATPVVAAAASLLVQTAGTTPFAAKPQTIKAVLLAGATKAEFATAPGGPWSHTQSVPLDVRFGAGQVNIDNSHRILSAGRQPANAAAIVAPTGWDFNSTASPASQQYYFDVPPEGANAPVSAALIWHRVISDSLAATPLTNLELRLHNASGFTLGSVIEQSISAVDNVEHIWRPGGLPAGRYAWAVEVNGSGSADFGFAWQVSFVPVPEPTSVLVVAAISLTVGRRVRRR